MKEWIKYSLWLLFLAGLFTTIILLPKPDSEVKREAAEIAQQETMGRLYQGEVQEVAKAPDGTVLYRAWDWTQGRVVYFSKSGTSWETQHMAGKVVVTDHHQVPSAR